jgi:hypothetical protein
MNTISSTHSPSSANYEAASRRAKTAEDFADLLEPQGTSEETSLGSRSTLPGTPTTISVNIGGTLRTFETVVYRGSDLPESAVTRIWEMPEAEYQEHLARMEAMVASLENTYAERPWTDTVEDSLRFSPASPITQTYATIKVGGSVVATIDNQGVTSSDDALSQMIQDFMADRAGGSNGPALAQDLADELAAILGGRVVIADTAMTQQEFDALPPLSAPDPIIDYEALRNDPWYTALESLKEKRAAYLAAQ